MSVTLQRQRKTGDSILGRMSVPGLDKSIFTLENLALAIPAGTYPCIPHDGPHWQDVWEITKVPGRIAILIHAGNTDVDTRGCVLVGLAQAEDAVLSSRDALSLLRSAIGVHSFTLTITDIPA